MGPPVCCRRARVWGRHVTRKSTREPVCGTCADLVALPARVSPLSFLLGKEKKPSFLLLLLSEEEGGTTYQPSELVFYSTRSK